MDAGLGIDEAQRESLGRLLRSQVSEMPRLVSLRTFCIDRVVSVATAVQHVRRFRGVRHAQQEPVSVRNETGRKL